MTDFRIGYGYDAHRLAPDRKLVLGGVEIPYEKGLLGHSDADVLVHAVCDALLGAAALGDIGRHFPDNDTAYKNIDSMILLKKVGELLQEKAYRIGNIDSCIRLQQPKIAAYIPLMQARMARTLGLEPDRVSVKATTTERMGFEGEELGASASAVALIYT
ncbi:MAG: 2-C-methyl-D-erythritol 2,4-cyclodiphosphate synthase [Bacteroidales bacterium]|nr:2-C-methyl-D-erythritol 2,4-cyclodiphosphate synthase [Bacteroidales bacterium]